MTSWRVTRNPEDDVTAGYNLRPTISRKIFLSKELKIDMNRFKSIWGLMLRI